MSGKTYTRKRFNLLIRKLIFEHDLLFVSLSQHSGQAKNVKATSECILNEQIPITIYDDGQSNPLIELHLMHQIQNSEVEVGTLIFDTRTQKIIKPLSKEFFSKQMTNKRGYAEYKFIGMEAKSVNEEQISKQMKSKSNLSIRINQFKTGQQEVNSMISLINEKDEIISKMDVQIKKLIRETKKLNKSLSKQKAIKNQQIQRNVSLNVKFNPSQISMQKTSKQMELQWQRQREQYQDQIQRLARKIRQFQSRERQYKYEIQILKKKIQVDSVKENEKRISNLKKQIEDHYDTEVVKGRMKSEEGQVESQNMQSDREKKNKYIEQQLAEQLRKIQVQKQRQFRRENVERQLQIQLQRQLEKQKYRQRQKETERVKQKEREKQREKSRNILKDPSVDQREFIKQIQNLDDQRQLLKQKLQIKDDQIREIVLKLQKAQKQIGKLEDENIQLRKTKSSLLREAENNKKMMKSSSERPQNQRQSIQEYQKLIINERKQIVDEKLRAELDEIRAKMKKDQRDFKQKLDQKQMELMKLRLSQKSASREKQIYSTRIKQMMQNVEGDRKHFLQALQNASKFQAQQTRTKQLEITNSELEAANYKMTKQKQQIQTAMKKLKAKIDERQGQWVRLKSVQSQHDYYKNQCEKFEKAYKKFEKQYESIKQYCQNLEHIVGKKPRKTFDDEINQQRQERYKSQVRSRVEVLVNQVKQMQNKFYKEQIEIWLTERTNIIQFYAKKYEEDKTRIKQMENINQDAKVTLMQQKLKQINSLKEQQIEDVDRKVIKLRALLKGEEHVTAVNVIVDKSYLDQKVLELNTKIQKMKEGDDARNKQVTTLKEKLAKAEAQLKQKNAKAGQYSQFAQQKRSIALFPDDASSKADEMRKSYLDQFKQSRDAYMNKPFEQLKKLNAELQAEKRKIESQLNTHKFNFDKERVQFNQKLRTKERQIKKLEHEAATNQKTAAKMGTDVESLRKTRDELELMIKKLREQLKEVSKTLQLKERQCSQALKQIQRMDKNLNAYEAAEKKMFEDVKRMKDKLEKREQQMQKIMQERDFKSKQIDAERVNDISKLEQKIKQLEFKLQSEISSNLLLSSQKQKLTYLITEYEVKLKTSEQKCQAIQENYDIFKAEAIEKQAVFEQQNHVLQKSILEIASQMEKKQSQCAQLQIKLQYADKRQEILKNIKGEIEEENKKLKDMIQELKDKQNKQLDKINQQIKSYSGIKDKIDAYVQQNAKFNLRIKELEIEAKGFQKQKHELEKDMIRAQCEKKNLENQLFYMKENYGEQIKKLELIISDKDIEMQRIRSQRSRVSIDDKAQKSSEVIQLVPGSPMIHRKMLNTSMQRSNSLIQGPKSSKNINTSTLLRRNSNKQPSQEENEQLFFSKEGIQVNVLKPVRQTTEEAKQVIDVSKRDPNDHNTSKVEIQVNSDEENPRVSNIESVFMKDKDVSQANISQTKPAQLKREFTEQDEDVDQQIDINHYHDVVHENQLLHQKLHELQVLVAELTHERDGFLEELNNLQATPGSVAKQSSLGSPMMSRLDQDRIKGDNLFLLRSINQDPSVSTRRVGHKNSGENSPQQTNQLQKSSAKKIDQFQKQIEQLKSKILQYELQISQHENQIKDLQQSLTAQQQGREKLVVQVDHLLQNLEEQVHNSKQTKLEMNALQQGLLQKIADLDHQLQQVIGQSLKKDEAVNETMSIIEKLNKQVKGQQNINQKLQNQVNNLKINIDKCNQTISNNKNQYRKYEQQAQLQILRLKQKVDQLNHQISMKDDDLSQLAERYVELENKIEQLNEQIKSKDGAVLTQRAKVKDANFKRDQALDQMRKFDSNKSGLLNRIGDLQMKLSQKTQQLKQLTKQTAIAYKKFQIQIDTQKEQHAMSKKKVKERDEHLISLKLQLANYNDKYYELEKERNGLNIELTRMQKQIKDIMVSYQQELDQLYKDKTTLAKQLEGHSSWQKQNQLKNQALNKQISRKNREIKELTFKIDQTQGSIQKIKQKNRKQVGELMSKLEIKNDEFYKIKIQLERQTEHYFSKQCEYLADREKKDKIQKEYNQKLEGYQKVLKQLEQELKQFQNRPSVDQWQQVCFENQLYKNRVQQLEQMLRDNDEQQEQKIIAQFKRYKLMKQKQIQDLESELEKYGLKFQQVQQSSYTLKKDNETMKAQLRTLMQQKMRLNKSIKQNEEDIRQLKEELSFYKAKRVDDLNKLLNQTYD